MVFWSELLIPCLLVVLSVQECLFPIEIRQWCPIQIGVLPLGINPDGFPFFKYDLFGLQLNRDLDYDFPFSKSGKDVEFWIWDPGGSKYKIENGGIRQWPDHIYENLSPFGAAIGILGVPLSTTSIILYIDVVFPSHLLCMFLGIREMFTLKTRDILFRFGSSLPQSDQTAALVHDHIDCAYFKFVMVLWRYHFGFCWIERSTLHMVLVNFLRQDLVGIDLVWRLKNGLAAFRWIGRLENALATLRWVLIDMKGSDIWADMVNFLCRHCEEDYTVAIFQRDFGTEVLVPLCLHFRISFGHIGFNVTFCKKKLQPQVAVHNS